MSQISIKKCDLCKKEYRSDVVRHWSDTIDHVDLNMKGHAGVQTRYELDLCTSCCSIIKNAIEETISKLRLDK